MTGLILMNQAIIALEKEMQAGTEAERSYLADYLENIYGLKEEV